jgi:hypothetical protein
MVALEEFGQGSENLAQQFSRLRQATHESMRIEEERRLKESPEPTQQELYMGAFKEWLEPQVRDAIVVMYQKGYATQSSGFDGMRCELQSLDGNFDVDYNTETVLRRIGVEVLRGPDLGLPKNKLITILRFRARSPDISVIKQQWDRIAAILPQKALPPGILPICDRAEEFRLEYAPRHPSLDTVREKYHAYLRNKPPFNNI